MGGADSVLSVILPSAQCHRSTIFWEHQPQEKFGKAPIAPERGMLSAYKVFWEVNCPTAEHLQNLAKFGWFLQEQIYLPQHKKPCDISTAWKMDMIVYFDHLTISAPSKLEEVKGLQQN